MKVIKIDVVNNYFEFNYKELLEIYNLRKEILWVDCYTNKQMLHVPFEYNGDMLYNQSVNEIEKCLFQFTENCTILSPLDLKLLNMFHYNWYNSLKDYFLTDEFKQLLIKCSQKKYDVKKLFWDFLVNPKIYNTVYLYDDNRIIKGYEDKELHVNYFLNDNIDEDLNKLYLNFWKIIIDILKQKKEFHLHLVGKYTKQLEQ